MSTTTNIEITDRALEEFGKMDVEPGGFLRITVVPGGCSGMTYAASVETEMQEDDETMFERDGLRIVSDPGSASFLEGMRIDYSDDLIKSGFRFLNPNAAGSCGCGASFAG